METKEEFEAREINGQTKVCTICKEDLPKTKFYYWVRKRYSGAGGRYEYWTISGGCKDCLRKRKGEAYKRKSEKKRKYDETPIRRAALAEEARLEALERDRKLEEKRKIKQEKSRKLNEVRRDKKFGEAVKRLTTFKPRSVLINKGERLTGIHKEADEILRQIFFMFDNKATITSKMGVANMMDMTFHEVKEAFDEALEEFYYLFWASDIPDILIDIVIEQNKNTQREIYPFEEEKK